LDAVFSWLPLEIRLANADRTSVIPNGKADSPEHDNEGTEQGAIR
jgi:hypothetical protein